MEWENIKRIVGEKLGYPMVSPEECRILYKTLERVSPKSILELGVGRGCFTLTTLLWCKENGGFLESVDIGTLFNIPPNLFKELGVESFWKFSLEDDRTKKWEKPIDFLILDSSHLYAHTKFELEKYTPFLTETGEVFLHDVLHNTHAIAITAAVLDFVLKKRIELQGRKTLNWNYQFFNTWCGIGRLYRTVCEGEFKSG